MNPQRKTTISLILLLASGALGLLGACGKDAPQDRGRKLKAQLQRQKIRESVEGTWRSSCSPLFLTASQRGLFARVEFRLDGAEYRYTGEKLAFLDAECEVLAFTVTYGGSFVPQLEKQELELRRESLVLTPAEANVTHTFDRQQFCGQRWILGQPIRVEGCAAAGARFERLYLRGANLFEAQDCPDGIDADTSDPRAATPERPPLCERYFLQPAR